MENYEHIQIIRCSNMVNARVPKKSWGNLIWNRTCIDILQLKE